MVLMLLDDFGYLMLVDDFGYCLNRHVNFYLINFSEIDYFLLNIIVMESLVI